MGNKDITICLTSCGRFALLERTIKSLVEFWDGPKPTNFIIHEDSGHEIPEPILDFIRSWVGSVSVYTSNKIGQFKGADLLYKKVKTPYIFHCEDDWEFYRTGFIEPSLDILESDPKILQVWIRNQNDRNGHPVIGHRIKAENGTQYQRLSRDYRKTWCGYSQNPGLRRLSDYQSIMPYSQYITGNSMTTEAAIGRAYKAQGFYAATLLTGHVRHIGASHSLDKREIK